MAAATVNERILERAVRHGIFLERYKASLSREIIAFLNDEVFPKLNAQILQRLATFYKRGFDPGPGATNRLQLMQYAINDILRGGDGPMSDARSLLTEDLYKLARQEGQFSTAMFDGLTPLQVSWSMPSASLLRAVVAQRPFGGALLRDWWSKLAVDTRNNVMRSIRTGIATGATTDEIVRGLIGTQANGYRDGILDMTRRSANALVRTAIASVATQAREEVFKENEDIIKGEQWVATLDDRTCIECGAMDGEVYDMGTGPRPPFHIGCRCTMVPVVKSWKELGIDAAEAPPGLRSSLDGEVPSTMTFEDWIKGQDETTQNEVLGATRADLFRAGKLDITDFVQSDTGQLMTLAELRQAEPDVFAGAKEAKILTGAFDPKEDVEKLQASVRAYQAWGGTGELMPVVEELEPGGPYYLTPVTDGFQNQLEWTYDAIPQDIKDRMDAAGYRVVVMGSENDAINDIFKDVGPKAIGVKDGEEKVIAIAEYNGEGKVNNTPINTLMHEVGHFTDANTLGEGKNLCDAPEFVNTAKAEYDFIINHPEINQARLSYYLEELHDENPEEVWAEMFANYMGAADRSSEDLVKAMPKTYQVFLDQMRAANIESAASTEIDIAQAAKEATVEKSSPADLWELIRERDFNSVVAEELQGYTMNDLKIFEGKVGGLAFIDDNPQLHMHDPVTGEWVNVAPTPENMGIDILQDILHEKQRVLEEAAKYAGKDSLEYRQTKELIDRLTPFEFAQMRNYNEWANKTDPLLRAGGTPTKSDLLINEALQKYPVYEGEVYRFVDIPIRVTPTAAEVEKFYAEGGIGSYVRGPTETELQTAIDKSFLADYKVGTVVVDPAFAHASLDEGYAAAHFIGIESDYIQNVEFVINSKSGREYYLTSGNYRAEREILFPMGSSFRVDRIETDVTVIGKAGKGDAREGKSYEHILRYYLTEVDPAPVSEVEAKKLTEASKPFTDLITGAYADLPANVRTALEDSSYSIRTGYTLEDISRQFADPRDPMRYAAGVTDDKGRTINIPEYIINFGGGHLKNEEAGSALVHEIGHALEGRFPSSPEFKDAFNTDLQELINVIGGVKVSRFISENEYFLNTSDMELNDKMYWDNSNTVGRQETFAEIFAEIMGNSAYKKYPLMEFMPRTTRLIRRYIKGL